MAPKSKPRVQDRFVAGADKTAALDHVVPAVEGRRSEVFVYGVDLEVLEWVDWG